VYDSDVKKPSIYAPTSPNLDTRLNVRDVDRAVAEKVVAEIATDIRAGRIELRAVSPLERVAQQIADKPVTGRAEFIRILETEPALAARVLHLANTRYRDVRKPSTRTLEKAVNAFGPHQLKQLIATMASQPPPHDGWETVRHALRKLWTNTLFTAFAARALADTTQAADPEEVFVAALFHNIGETVLLSEFGRRNPNPEEFIVADAVLQVIDEQHEATGGALLASWEFPDDICAVARSHHGEMPTPVHAAVVAGWMAALDYGYAYFAHRFDAPRLGQACDALGCRVGLIAQVTRRIGPALNAALTLSV